MKQLTEAEIERLALLAEECGETIQVIGKILRHGYDSRWPLPDGDTNRTKLEREIGDIHVAIDLLYSNEDVNEERVDDAYTEKGLKINKWLHHNTV